MPNDVALDHDVHFIAKPFNLSALAAKVREVLATADEAPGTQTQR